MRPDRDRIAPAARTSAGQARRPDQVVGEDRDRGPARQPTISARWWKTSRAVTTPVGRPSSTIGMWRNPPTAILWIATAIGVVVAQDDRVAGHEVADRRTASSGLPATFTTASRSVKIPTSRSPSVTSTQSTASRRASGAIASSTVRVRRRSAAAATPRASRCSPSEPAVERRVRLRHVGAGEVRAAVVADVGAGEVLEPADRADHRRSLRRLLDRPGLAAVEEPPRGRPRRAARDRGRDLVVDQLVVGRPATRRAGRRPGPGTRARTSATA